MLFTKEEFKNNLISLLTAHCIAISKNDLFIVKAIEEENVTYNSFDDYVRLWFLTPNNINRHFSLIEVIDFLSFSNNRYPLWVKVKLVEVHESYSVFELCISMRFRKPSELKHKELGYPPFIFEKII